MLALARSSKVKPLQRPMKASLARGLARVSLAHDLARDNLVKFGKGEPHSRSARPPSLAFGEVNPC